MRKLVIGIDISKSTIDATIVYLEKKETYHDAFLNKNIGFNHLLKWGKKHSENSPLFFCIENTGHYGRALCKYLEKEGEEYAQINASEIKMSMGIKREKSDKSDSKMIALYGLKFPERMHAGNLLKEDLLNLQLMLAERKLIQEKELAFQRSLKLTKHCLSDNKIAKEQVKRNSRLRKYLQKERKKVEGDIEEYVAEISAIKKNYDLLQTIPGIGKIIALQSIVQTQNFEGIKDARKFACYCGIAPFKNESGTSIRKGTRVSFYGHKKLKKNLNFGAMNAVKCDPQLKEYYQKKVAAGKNKMSVLNAVRNKLVQRMYSVIKRETPYVIQPTFH